MKETKHAVAKGAGTGAYMSDEVCEGARVEGGHGAKRAERECEEQEEVLSVCGVFVFGAQKYTKSHATAFTDFSIFQTSNQRRAGTHVCIPTPLEHSLGGWFALYEWRASSLEEAVSDRCVCAHVFPTSERNHLSYTPCL